MFEVNLDDSTKSPALNAHLTNNSNSPIESMKSEGNEMNLSASFLKSLKSSPKSFTNDESSNEMY